MNTFSSDYELVVSVVKWIYEFGPAILVLLPWGIFWKGIALWHAGRRNEPWWFVLLLIINTIGIFEIVYLFFIIKLKPRELFSSESERAETP